MDDELRQSELASLAKGWNIKPRRLMFEFLAEQCVLRGWWDLAEKFYREALEYPTKDGKLQNNWIRDNIKLCENGGQPL